MSTTLHALLFVLKAIEVVVVLTVLLLIVDFIYSEMLEWKRDADRVIDLAREDVRRTQDVASHSMGEMAKAKLRARKEAEALQSFFTEGYFRGFDRKGRLIYRGATAPCEPDWEFVTEVDLTVDDQIFFNTKEL